MLLNKLFEIQHHIFCDDERRIVNPHSELFAPFHINEDRQISQYKFNNCFPIWIFDPANFGSLAILEFYFLYFFQLIRYQRLELFDYFLALLPSLLFFLLLCHLGAASDSFIKRYMKIWILVWDSFVLVVCRTH